MATQRLNQLEQRLHHAFQQSYQQHSQRFELQRQKLQAYSPLQVMERGYALVLDENQHLIRSVQQLEPQQTITVQIHDGEAVCQIQTVHEKGVTM